MVIQYYQLDKNVQYIQFYIAKMFYPYHVQTTQLIKREQTSYVQGGKHMTAL